MPTAKPSSSSLAKRFGIPESIRWMTLDAYDMKIKLAVYKDGKALVVENGEPHADALSQLGFQKAGDEWLSYEISFTPHDYKSVFPDARAVKDVPIEEVVVDRSSASLPVTPKEEDRRAFNGLSKRIASAARDTPSKLPQLQVWFAEVIIGDHTVHAFGITPEQAMRVLAATWTSHAARENTDVSLLVRYRDSISVNSAEVGQGFAIGMGDAHWYKGGYNGSDQRFDGILAEVPSASHTRALQP